MSKIPKRSRQEYEEKSVVDDDYFKSYSNLDVHLGMIDDKIRTNAYRYAILKNYPLFYNKTVLELGAGTGILSLFCVQAGAKKVYAVEASKMASEAKRVVEENGYADKIVVIREKIEDCQLPEKVDVIVSEWMGYLLFYESMLHSLLYARDTYLKKGGHMFPSKAQVFMTAVEEDEEECHDVIAAAETFYKVKLNSLKRAAENNLNQIIRVTPVDPINIRSNSYEISNLDLLTLSSQDILHVYVKCPYSLKLYGRCKVDSFCFHFQVTFPGNIILTTSPYQPDTHWLQCLTNLRKPIKGEQDDLINGNITITRTDGRGLKVGITYYDTPCNKSLVNNNEFPSNNKKHVDGNNKHDVFKITNEVQRTYKDGSDGDDKDGNDDGGGDGDNDGGGYDGYKDDGDKGNGNNDGGDDVSSSSYHCTLQHQEYYLSQYF